MSVPMLLPHILAVKSLASTGELTQKIGLGEKRKRLSPDDGKRIRFSPPTKELPEELYFPILARLPIKSVLRFKSVCKSWISLFSDPQFIKEHNDHRNPNDYDCLVVDKSSHIVILSRYEEKFVLDNDSYHLIGCANGLVCMRSDKVVSLWNPATRQSKEFHLPPISYGCLERAGFGFDPVSNVYKVGICYRSLELSCLCYAVYSSRSDTWTRHRFDDPDYEILISEFRDSLTPTTMVKDSPYWTCYTTVPSGKGKITLSLAALKFDANSNKFEVLHEFSSDFSNEKTFKVLNMRDLLSFMAYEACPVRKLDVYSLDEEKGCGGGVWSKMYSFGPFEEFWRFRFLQQGFKCGDEIVFYKNGKIYRFNHKMGTFECIPGIKPLAMCDCFTYTPSLVFLRGMTSIYSEKQTPPLGDHSKTPLRLLDSLRDHLPY